MSGRIVLTAGHERARHVTALAELLTRSSVPVAGVIMVRAIGRKRIRQVLRRQGFGALVALARQTVRGQAASHGTDPLQEFLVSQDIRPARVSDWARAHGVPVRRVADLNGPAALRQMKAWDPEVVIYGGGGILRESFLESARWRVLNAHAGPLPAIRGMNAAEWAVLLGQPREITVHFIDRGIDTGAVVLRRALPPLAGATVEQLRGLAVVTGIAAMVDVVLSGQWRHGGLTPTGPLSRQCYALAPVMRELLALRLARARA